MQRKPHHHELVGGLDAIKSQYPQLIQRAEAITEDRYEDSIPSTPDAVDKENFTMTEILPHLFVGMYSLLFILKQLK